MSVYGIQYTFLVDKFFIIVGQFNFRANAAIKIEMKNVIYNTDSLTASTKACDNQIFWSVDPWSKWSLGE